MLSSAPMLAAWLTFIFLLFSPLSFAQTSPTWTDCFSGQNNSLKLDVSTVYAQISENESFGRHLSLTLLGTTPQAIQNLAEGSSSLSTLFTTTDVLTFNLWFNSSAFCGGLRPASPLPSVNGSSYCPLSPGPFAFSSVVPLNDTNELLTLQTRLRAVDSLSNELLCVDVDTTPLSPGVLDNAYGHAKIIFWSTIALAAAFWLIVGGARLSAAWGRRAGWSGRGVWSHVETLGFVVASAVSGEAFAKTPALLRFGTPSMRDIFFHTQWCAAVGMVAVQWPQFVYPLLTQAGWATLSYNITVAQPSDRHWNPLSIPAFQPPSNFADQLTDQSSPLFINTTAPNLLYTLPAGSASGLESWAYTIGLYPQDMFGVCMSLFLGIIAGIIILSLVLWAIDTLAGIIGRMVVGGRTTPGGFLRSPRYSSTSKEMLDATSQGHVIEEDRRSASGNFLLRSTAKLFPNPSRHHWPRIFPDFYGSFHFSVLHGNLVRILILFHLPVTIFSSYHMTIGRGSTPLSSIILAACSLVVFSIVIPVFLVARLSFTSTNKLYDETRTLLSLGPLYNHYRQGSQFFASLFFATNVAFGVTIGCGQKSGTAQAVVILVIEVISALFTSVWLPWGHGASMGLISFLFCVARIVVAVLLIIMTPTVSIGGEAGQWVAYVILFILGLVYLSFLLMLASKIIEVFVRIVGGAGFDSGRSTIDSGLLGACALAGCCGSRRRRKHRHRAKQSDATAPRPPSQPFAKPVMDVTPTPSGPPSVLRPEQALRPYKEDTDDESGYIMGAWHRPGYEAVANEGPSPRLESPMLNKSSGFSRVAGGRANFDAPYAIATGSTISFPSVDRAEHPTPTSTQRRNSNNSLGMPPASFTDAERTYGNLPPGAMAPHMRTKSQSAIIEHTLGTAGTAVQQSSPVVMPPRRQSMRPEIVSPDTEDDPSDSEDQRRSNRKWYQWKSSSRRHSEGDDSRPTDALDDAGGPDGGRTFLGARKKRRASALEPLNKEEDFSTLDGPPKKSFVVVRPAVSGRSTPLLSTPGAGPSGSRS